MARVERHVTLRLGRRVEDPPAQLRWHDLVAFCYQHEQRYAHIADLLGQRIAVEQEDVEDRQERVVVTPDVGERWRWRPEDQGSRWPLCRQTAGDGGPERLAEVGDATGSTSGRVASASTAARASARRPSSLGLPGFPA